MVPLVILGYKFLSMTSTSAAIAAIAFDLGNVLVKVDHLRFCRRLAQLAGMSPEEVYAAVFQTGLEPGYDTGRLSSREFHRRLQAHFRLDLPYSRFRELWTEIFAPLDDMEEVAARLARRYPLYLLVQHQCAALPSISRTHFAALLKPFPGLHPVLSGGQPQTRGGHLPGPDPAGRPAAGPNSLHRRQRGFCGRGPDPRPGGLALCLARGF